MPLVQVFIQYVTILGSLFSPCISVKLTKPYLKVFAGIAPFDGRRRRLNATIVEIGLHGHLRLPQPDGISDGLWKIICRCWGYDPVTRPHMEDVVGSLIALHSQVSAPPNLESRADDLYAVPRSNCDSSFV